MTPNPQSGSTPATPTTPWPALDIRECRVLGVLVEKAKTTPDAYPLSLNALVTGCNQKSNREPVLDLDEGEVEDTLVKLQDRGYVQRVFGGRVERSRHLLYESWHVNKVELAILAELLLRGPQTEGELRSRASRMEPIEDLDALRPILRSLAGRDLVVYLSPEGRRGTTITHGFHGAAEVERMRSSEAAAPRSDPEGPSAARPAASAAPRPDLEAQIAELRVELDTMRASLAQMQGQVAALVEQLRGLKNELGG